MPRLALVTLACTSVLLTQPACESCDFNFSDLTINLEVTLTDLAGQPLDAPTFLRLRDAAELTQCVDDGSESCGRAHLEDTDDDDGTFTVRAYGQAYENGLRESGRCSYPDLRVTVEIPGCEPGAFELEGGPTTKNRHETDASLTLACAPADLPRSP